MVRTISENVGIIFHGYQDMSQDKGNISVRCQMRGKIYKRPIHWGANAKIKHTQIQKLNYEKYVLSVLMSWESFTKVDRCNNLYPKFTI